ncbi:hypothetical protein GOE08_06610 [Sinorhizobium medicae]|nr:hypothetical protein [Sinorhizobium medicae]MDX1006557.1 hypothetical protein [Sinorhizobium medicae]
MDENSGPAEALYTEDGDDHVSVEQFARNAIAKLKLRIIDPPWREAGPYPTRLPEKLVADLTSDELTETPIAALVTVDLFTSRRTQEIDNVPTTTGDDR